MPDSNLVDLKLAGADHGNTRPLQTKCAALAVD
jgi:hypothetical protein